jgi:hypothetical protein
MLWEVVPVFPDGAVAVPYAARDAADRIPYLFTIVFNNVVLQFPFTIPFAPVKLF